ncbi:16S rRNA (uracil(1498)-N(3))-methyltransferase [Streptobacillus felis]|uniref:Ribosomal RNA small subunit methyltransferase E n=1 Tax=Streptobacillus felis TaxID=1384509 RepID=A0A7Z0PE22_9FUSO|nr:RsmE family RNA methyltransferase [Streptobacillus felis]NYV27549.1 16S rRNA (uracil(1498)-N(3))-methyltransferase [Streptobacillus felis]
MLTVIADKILGNLVEINEITEINHIKNVYRLKENDEVRVIDFEYEYRGIIKEINKKNILISISEKKEDQYSLPFNIDIAIGLLKNEKMKLLIQKLTELGIRNIIPLKTERVVVKINEKKEKWDLVVRESMKQCRAIKKTNVEILNEIKRIKYGNYDKIIYAYENSSSSLNIKDAISKDDRNILIIIGPEGGFTLEEVEYLKSVGAIEISLGKRILRAETAAIVLTGSIINIKE